MSEEIKGINKSINASGKEILYGNNDVIDGLATIGLMEEGLSPNLFDNCKPYLALSQLVLITPSNKALIFEDLVPEFIQFVKTNKKFSLSLLKSNGSSKDILFDNLEVL